MEKYTKDEENSESQGKDIESNRGKKKKKLEIYVQVEISSFFIKFY